MKKLFIAGLALCALYSCKNDDPTEEKEVRTEVDLDDVSSLTGVVPVFEALDPSTVSSNIGLTNATRVSGSPTSTDNLGAPELSSNGNEETLRVAQGSEFEIPLVSNDDDIAGYFVQIEGADEYYDIPKTSEDSERKAFETHTKAFRQITDRHSARVGESEDVVEIAIPESIQPGKFCVLVCVYDTDGYVSLPITRCIEVQSFGGEGAEFIINNEWNFTHLTTKVDFDGGDTIFTVTKDEWFQDSETVTIFCEETFEFQEYEYVGQDKLEEFSFNFTSNGGMELVTIGDENDYNYEKSQCQSELVYETTTYNDKETGAWSYDASTETITMLFDDYTDEDGSYVEPYFIDFKAQEVNNQLVLSYSEDLGEGNSVLIVYYFDKN